MTDYTKKTIQFHYTSTISVSFSEFKESMGDCFTDEDAKKVWAKMIENYKEHKKTDKLGYDVDEGCNSTEMEFYECEDKLQEIRDEAVDELGVKEKDM
jgi:hypothetical protein